MRKMFGRRLRVETLENRQMLYACIPGMAFSPMVMITNNEVPALDVIAGDTNKLVADMTLRTTGRDYARLREMLFLSAFGSEPLAQNATFLTVKADLNGKSNDGCEAFIGGANPDWETDVASITMTRAVWVRSQGLHVQVYADFAPWSFTGNTFGVELAEASFRDLRNNQIPARRVVYNGADPTLITLNNARLWIDQWQMLPYGSISEGTKAVPMVRFDMSGENAVADTISFTPYRGLLFFASNYMICFDTNRDGVFDGSVPGTISGVEVWNQVLTFNLSSVNPNGWFEVRADFLSGTAGRSLNLTMTGNPVPTGHNAETGQPLKGYNWHNPFYSNGQNGQIIVHAGSTDWSTTYNVVTPPTELVVRETEANLEFAMAEPGQAILVNAGVLTATSDMAVTNMIFTDLGNPYHDPPNYSYALWVDTNADSKADSKLSDGRIVDTYYGPRLFFDSQELILLPGKQIAYEVRAIAPLKLGYLCPWLNIQLSSVSANKPDGSVIAADKIFLDGAWQTRWWINDGTDRG